MNTPIPHSDSWKAGRKAAFGWFAAHGHALVLELANKRAQHAQAIYEQSPDDLEHVSAAVQTFTRAFAFEVAELLRDEVRS